MSALSLSPVSPFPFQLSHPFSWPVLLSAFNGTSIRIHIFCRNRTFFHSRIFLHRIYGWIFLRMIFHRDVYISSGRLSDCIHISVFRWSPNRTLFLGRIEFLHPFLSPKSKPHHLLSSESRKHNKQVWHSKLLLSLPTGKIQVALHTHNPGSQRKQAWMLSAGPANLIIASCSSNMIAKTYHLECYFLVYTCVKRDSKRNFSSWVKLKIQQLIKLW